MNIKITQPAAPLTLILNLSGLEARVLRTVCRNIGGLITGPRSVTEKIEAALADHGVDYYNPSKSHINGSIRFPSHWSDLVEN